MAAKIHYKIFFPILLTCSLLVGSLNATHIIGGEMTFECLSPGEYRVTMKVYRDCALGLAAFDSQAGGLTGTVSIFSEGGSNLDGQIRLDPPLVESIPNDAENPCLVVPPNICVESGTYTFDVSLPVSDESYYIVYQRCCRNNTINNIFEPQSTGATYFIEITPYAQENCISTPTFDNFPPPVICSGFDLEFDHSASDDQPNSELVYSYYTPFVGGGLEGSPQLPGNPFSVNGVAPQPTSFPPYTEVLFIPPLYSRNTPLAGDPAVRINSSTGVISGRPDILGQFVVGVQAEQYVNGQLASVIRRDFQFNVTSCEPTVFAQIEADEIIDEREFVVNSCGNTEVTFNNQSFQEQFIDEYRWKFFVEGDTLLNSDRNATVNFPDTGTYKGILIANPDAELCNDTAEIRVNIFPFVEAKFQFDYDTCSAGPVEFEDLSFTGGSQLVGWDWKFKPEETTDLRNPSFEFSTSGTKEVLLEVADDNNCTDTITKEVPYFPLPPIIVVEPGKFNGCAPEEISFTNRSDFVTEDYEIFWDFGDGNTSEELNPSNLYEDPGTYDVFIRIISPFGCVGERRFRSIVEIFRGPEAGFSVSPTELTSIESRVSVTDLSSLAEGWQYNFNNEANYFFREPSHTIEDTGRVFVEQVVFKGNGCTDTARIYLDVVPFTSFHLPNAFTPNGDGVNDEYRGTGILEYISNFRMTIWNRWGEKVFETSNPETGWNGRKFNTGDMLDQGVYVAVVEYENPDGSREVIKEFATLIR